MRSLGAARAIGASDVSQSRRLRSSGGEDTADAEIEALGEAVEATQHFHCRAARQLAICSGDGSGAGVGEAAAEWPIWAPADGCRRASGRASSDWLFLRMTLGEMRAEMAKITYIAADGSRYEVEAENGSTVMENAIRNGVPGIEAECGGACACATCHVYVDEAFKEIVGEPEPMEEDMLDFAFDVRPTSRLSCQIRVRDELDGLTVTVPERQG